MRPIGFSTGALAYSNFQLGLRLVAENHLKVVELSALRYAELSPLVRALDSLDLSQFRYVSVHAPSRFDRRQESEVINLLGPIADRQWPIILHPNTVYDFSAWRRFGELLLVENMDKRYATGRTVGELEHVFSLLPKAGLCFDVGHCRQIDPTMSESFLILKRFRSRLGQLHVSEVNSQSKHNPLSDASVGAFEKISHLIPENIPIVLESPVQREEIMSEIGRALEALQPVGSNVGRKREAIAAAFS